MKATFKCENCLSVTVLSGEGPRHLGCQSCGCGDIKFDADVIVSPISSKDPGDIFPAVLAKKNESFNGNHSLGRSWRLSFPPPEIAAPPPPIIKVRRRGKGE